MTVTGPRWHDEVVRHLRCVLNIVKLIAGDGPVNQQLSRIYLACEFKELRQLADNPPRYLRPDVIMGLGQLRGLCEEWPIEHDEVKGTFGFAPERLTYPVTKLAFMGGIGQIQSIIDLLENAEPWDGSKEIPDHVKLDQAPGATTPETPVEFATPLAVGESNLPEAPTCPGPLNQTLEKLKGSSAAKDLIRFLAHQTDQKATLVDTARHRKRGRREPTRTDIKSTMQQVRRTAETLALRGAPLRIEYCWIQEIIRLVDRNGNPPALHINEAQM